MQKMQGLQAFLHQQMEGAAVQNIRGASAESPTYPSTDVIVNGEPNQLVGICTASPNQACYSWTSDVMTSTGKRICYGLKYISGVTPC
jgi:hypothetical protein